MATAPAALLNRDAMVLAHLRLVHTIAHTIADGLPLHAVAVEDLIGAGILGLFQAVARYDPGMNVLFTTYAKYRIRGQILDSLRLNDYVSRSARLALNQITAATMLLAQRQGSQPSRAEVAAELGVTIKRLDEMACAGLIVVRGDAPKGANVRSGDENSVLSDVPADACRTPERLLQHAELLAVMAAAIETLPERYRLIIRLYWFYGGGPEGNLSMRRIGRAMGIGESRISQIHSNALRKLRVALAKAGIRSYQELGLD